MAKKGLSLPSQPEFVLPKLRTDLTSISDDQLMRLMARLVRYQDFLHGQLVEFEIDETSAETMLEVAKARYLAAAWTGSSADRVAVAKANALADPDVRSYQDAYETCRAKRKLWGVLMESLARDAGVVSRELTRRLGRESTERRVDRYNP